MALSYSATRFQQQRGKNATESVYYLMKSISAVKEDLASSSKQVSDSTIATVASLANIENLDGNPQSAILHLNGMKQMVDMRGGLDSLGMRGILKRVVLWADLCGAARLQTNPRFPLLEFPDMPPISQFLQAENSASSTLIITDNLLEAAVSQSQLKCIQILRDLHELSNFLNDTGNHREDLPQEVCYPDRVYSVEHNTLTAITRMSDARDPSNIFSILLHASLLFIYTNLRQTPVGDQIRKSLSARLRSCIQGADVAFLQMMFPAELLWASLLGIVGGKETSDFNWFLSSVERLCMGNGIMTWEGATEFCIELPVLETSCRNTCEKLWARDVSF
ncbi:uncharacterized protein LY89DRAFT_54360 [Mollisia scopiformis]|uniref:Uncharacterized protein n=1 Tax=Mollisia scopiformis TaxID=149040 RepID=A0A194XBC3_MOLSC|nr:uncharacterized protein LY89DRAFT_54360 [Mollisia scopiformis]KUJ17475.1 hypothetical protein LY89DRAFT_54360 [Mollisia scopiformis]